MYKLRKAAIVIITIHKKLVFFSLFKQLLNLSIIFLQLVVNIITNKAAITLPNGLLEKYSAIILSGILSIIYIIINSSISASALTI